MTRNSRLADKSNERMAPVTPQKKAEKKQTPKSDNSKKSQHSSESKSNKKLKVSSDEEEEQVSKLFKGQVKTQVVEKEFSVI